MLTYIHNSGPHLGATVTSLPTGMFRKPGNNPQGHVRPCKTQDSLRMEIIAVLQYALLHIMQFPKQSATETTIVLACWGQILKVISKY